MPWDWSIFWSVMSFLGFAYVIGWFAFKLNRVDQELQQKKKERDAN